MEEPINQLSNGTFLNLIMEGGIISLIVLAILLVMSILSWGVIGWKWFLFNVSMRQADAFMSSLNLMEGLSDTLYRSESFESTYYAKQFQAAYEEYVDTYKQIQQAYYVGEKQDFISRIERAIEKCIVNESLRFDKSLIVLATISSAAPFIGLFGTVTGIIDAFYSIGSQGAASIAVVAPGISAALVATAFGLFAAIPALMGYNVFRNKTRIIQQEMESFGADLINLFDKEFSKTVTLSKPRPTRKK